jgi:hypothetical protein
VKHSYSQQEKVAHLSKTFKEISGLAALNDTLLFAVNDGGNEACLYIINLKGDIVREITLKTAKNNDWEDLAIDEKKEFLYIGDVGNNTNERKKLIVYKLKVEDCFNGCEVATQKLTYSYPDQLSYPASKDSMYYDCEAIAVMNERIYFFTKDNSTPYQGISKIYSMDTSGANFKFEQAIFLGKKGYYQNSITAVDYHKGQFYLSTYTYLFVFNYINGAFKRVSRTSYKRLTQKESLAVVNPKAIFLADEKSPFGIGQNLYKISLKND